MPVSRFGPAVPEEETVYGAAGPGRGSSDPAADIDDWIAAVRAKGIDRVCCLLSADQLKRYGDLIGQYRVEFGHDRVLHAPVEEHHLADREILQADVLPFLRVADDAGDQVVVHCRAGLGRTGHVLAAWLVHARGYKPDAAIEAVAETGRMPAEAVRAGNAAEAELAALLESVGR